MNLNTEEEEVAAAAAVAAARTSGPQTKAILRVILIALAVAAALWILYKLESVILLLVLAIFFAYLIAPLVDFFNREVKIGGKWRQVPRPLAIGIVYILVFGSLVLALSMLIPRLGEQVTEFAKKAPDYARNARDSVKGLSNYYNPTRFPPPVQDAIETGGQRTLSTLTDYATSFASGALGVLSYIPWLILIPILAFFLLKDADSFRRGALLTLPSGRWRWRGDEFFQDVNSTLAAYIRAQLIACLLIGTACTIGFAIIGVPYSLTFGVTAGLLEFIPLVGPITVAVVVAGMTAFSAWRAALVVLLFLAVLRMVEDYVVYPRLIGQGIHLHPLAVILAVLCGAELGGVAGIFLAIPVVAIATVSYRHWMEHRGSDGLVADILKPAAVPGGDSPGESVADSTALPGKTATDGDGETLTPKAPVPMEREIPSDMDTLPHHHSIHPSISTTREEMLEARPDLATGELKLPDELS